MRLLTVAIQGKKVLLKEHTISLQSPDSLFRWLHGDDGSPPFVLDGYDKAASQNPTSLPDELLLQLNPIFLIRHPGLMYPSE